ncbi:MAG: signal peptidase I [Candidatus Limnocylindrales bacterium]
MPATPFRSNGPGRRPALGSSRLRTVARGIRRAFLAVLAVLFLAGAGLVTYSVLSGNWTIAPILSGSMRPGFPVGGVVVAERTPTSALAVGDVILFQNPIRPSERMVHRIIQLKVDPSGQMVVNTKGDANNVDDPWTASLQGDSIYVAQLTLPLLGYAAVSTTPGTNLMIGGVILLLVAVSTVMSRERRVPAEKAGASHEASRLAGVTASAPQDGIPG